MSGLGTTQLAGKGVRSGLRLKDGQIHLWNKAAGSEQRFPITDVIGVDSKKPGLGRGWLCVRTLTHPRGPTGTMEAMSHPMTVAVAIGRWSDAEEFVRLASEYLTENPPTEHLASAGIVDTQGAQDSVAWKIGGEIGNRAVREWI